MTEQDINLLEQCKTRCINHATVCNEMAEHETNDVIKLKYKGLANLNNEFARVIELAIREIKSCPRHDG